MVRDEPASLPHRTLLALALLKQNRAQDALAVYANLKVPSNAVSASAVAVHASVLAATGRKDEARDRNRQSPVQPSPARGSDDGAAFARLEIRGQRSEVRGQLAKP